MRIDHAAIYVTDLEKTREFFVCFFGATAGDLYRNPATGLSTYFLSFAGRSRLEIMHRPDCAPGSPDTPHIGYAHLAFALGDRAEVDRLTATLRAHGYRTISGPRVTGDGYYESLILGPDDLPIELTE